MMNRFQPFAFMFTLRRYSAARHAAAVEAILGGALRWYAGEHERDCLAEVRAARSRMWEDSPVESPLADDLQSDSGVDDATTGRGRGSIVNRVSGGPPARLTHGFHTRLSNVHACVASLRALRADCPLLWRTGADSLVSPAGASSGAGAGADRAAHQRGLDNWDASDSDDSDCDGEATEVVGVDDTAAAAAATVGPGRYCPPHHPTHCEPAFPASNAGLALPYSRVQESTGIHWNPTLDGIHWNQESTLTVKIPIRLYIKIPCGAGHGRGIRWNPTESNPRWNQWESGRAIPGRMASSDVVSNMCQALGDGERGVLRATAIAAVLARVRHCGRHRATDGYRDPGSDRGGSVARFRDASRGDEAGVRGRGVHSSACLLNQSRSCYRNPASSPRIPQKCSLHTEKWTSVSPWFECMDAELSRMDAALAAGAFRLAAAAVHRAACAALERLVGRDG